MRTIKFRGKNIETGEWVYGFYTQGGYVKEDGTVKVRHIIHSDILYDVEECSIGQFTGLYTNGIEIYEGDIVEWTFFYNDVACNGGVIYSDTIVKGIIEWEQGGFILKVTENDFENAGQYGISSLVTDTENDVIVIGNIHDNPELLKGE